MLQLDASQRSVVPGGSSIALGRPDQSITSGEYAARTDVGYPWPVRRAAAPPRRACCPCTAGRYSNPCALRPPWADIDTYWAAPFDHDQGRAGSLHPEGQCSVDQMWTARQDCC